MNRIVIFVMVVLCVGYAAAQDDCAPVVEELLATVGDVCSATERNQACYGNVSIEAELADADLTFETAGDIVDLADLETLTLEPFDADNEEWGVALLQVQANLPETLPGQNVTILLFGDVQLENQNELGDAFYFTSGVGSSDCAEAPDGILIQSPGEADEQVSLTINDTEVTFGSTLYLTAEEDEEMAIALLEGTAVVEADGEEQELDPGTFVTVPLDGVNADGAPSEPEPLPEDATVILPVSVLPEEVPLPDATPEAGASGGAGSTFTLRSGMWTARIGELGGDCSAEMMEMMSQGMASVEMQSFELPEGFDAEQIVQTFTMAAGMGEGSIENPEPNVYVYTNAGGVFRIELISETEFHMTVSSDAGGCTLEIPFIYEFQG